MKFECRIADKRHKNRSRSERDEVCWTKWNEIENRDETRQFEMLMWEGLIMKEGATRPELQDCKIGGDHMRISVAVFLTSGTGYFSMSANGEVTLCLKRDVCQVVRKKATYRQAKDYIDA